MILSTIIWLSVVLAGGRPLVAEQWWSKQSVQAWISGDLPPFLYFYQYVSNILTNL